MKSGKEKKKRKKRARLNWEKNRRGVLPNASLQSRPQTKLVAPVVVATIGEKERGQKNVRRIGESGPELVNVVGKKKKWPAGVRLTIPLGEKQSSGTYPLRELNSILTGPPAGGSGAQSAPGRKERKIQGGTGLTQQGKFVSRDRIV